MRMRIFLRISAKDKITNTRVKEQKEGHNEERYR
jgi:hypothetical protein